MADEKLNQEKKWKRRIHLDGGDLFLPENRRRVKNDLEK